MPSETQDRADVKPEGEKPAVKSLFDEAKDDFSSFWERQKKNFDNLTSSKDNVVDAKFGSLTLTDNASAAAKPDDMVARAGKPEHVSESIKEAQATVVRKESSQEEKLSAANQMAKEGQTTFTGPDGRRYDISVNDVGGRSIVSIHTNDSNGNSHPVLRGYVEQDGSVHKQTDANGTAVPYEGNWAGRNLKDSPLIGSKEKADPVAESPENAQLKKTLADQGIAPTNQTPAERTALAKEHAQLQDQVAQHKARKEALQAQADEKNKPFIQQQDRLYAQNDKLYDQMQDIRKDVYPRNEKLAAELKEKGIGDGSTIDLEKHEVVQKVKADIDANKDIDDATKKRFKDELTALEKKTGDLTKMNLMADRNLLKADQLGDIINKNQEPVNEESTKLRDAHKALRENEHKLAESKFSDDLKEIDKLPKEKREAVYKALDQIAKDGGGEPNHLTAEQRKQLVMETAHQIANPEAIRQGTKGTCGLASTEVELAKNNPEKYAQYVADLATKGVAKTADGRELHIQSELINAKDKDGNLVAHDDGNPFRSLSSKIFQSAAANRVLEDRALAANPPENPPTYDTQRPGAKYPIELGEVKLGGKGEATSTHDTGERIVYKDGKVEHWNGVDSDEISKLTTELTGQKYESKAIINGRDMSKPEQEAAAEQDFIAAAEKNGLPMKVSLTMTKGDFTGMNAEGGHEVVVTRIEKGNPNMVYFDNTAGGTDHSYPTGRPVPMKDFLTAMQQTRMSDGTVHDQGYVITKAE